MVMRYTTFDETLQRVQNMEPFTVSACRLQPGSNEVEIRVLFTVTPEVLVPELVVNPHNLREQIDVIAGQIGHWARNVASQERVLEVLERRKRVWQARRLLETMHPEDPPKDWKKPTKEVGEALYRTHEEYDLVYARIEEAQESLRACQGVLDAFKAKKDVLIRDVFRATDGSLHRVSV